MVLWGMREDSDWTPGTSEHHDELPADAEEGPEVEPKELGAGSCGMFMYFSQQNELLKFIDYKMTGMDPVYIFFFGVQMCSSCM